MDSLSYCLPVISKLGFGFQHLSLQVTLSCQSCREGNIEVLRYLLSISPTIWNTTSNNLRTPLHTAGFKRRSLALLKNTRNLFQALVSFLTALYGRLETLQLLLSECNYDINAQDSCGTSPLFDAIIGEHVECVQELLKSKVR